MYTTMSTDPTEDGQQLQGTAPCLPTDVVPDAEPVYHGDSEMMGPCFSTLDQNKTFKSNFYKTEDAGQDEHDSIIRDIKQNAKADIDQEHGEDELLHKELVKGILSKLEVSEEICVVQETTTQQDSDQKSSPTSLPPAGLTYDPPEDDLALSAADLDDMPDDLQMKHFDVFIITARKDEESGLHLKDLLESITIKDNKTETEVPCKVCCLEGSELAFVSGKINTLVEGLKRSTFTYVYITPSFVDDAWAIYQKDETLMASVEDADRRWSIVPVFTLPKGSLELPAGFRSLKGLDMSRVLCGQTLSTCKPFTHEELYERDRYFLPHVQNMLGQRLSRRLCREETQQKAREEWVSTKKLEIRKRRLQEHSLAEGRKKREGTEIEELKKDLARKAAMESARGQYQNNPGTHPGQGQGQAMPGWTRQGQSQAMPRWNHPDQGQGQGMPGWTYQGQGQAMPEWTHPGHGQGQAMPVWTHPGHGQGQAMPVWTHPGQAPPGVLMPMYYGGAPSPWWPPPPHAWPPPPPSQASQPPTVYNIYNPNMLQLGNANTQVVQGYEEPAAEPPATPPAQSQNWRKPEPPGADSLLHERVEQHDPGKELLLEEGNRREFSRQTSIGGPLSRDLRLHRNEGPKESLECTAVIADRNKTPADGAVGGENVSPQYTAADDIPHKVLAGQESDAQTSHRSPPSKARPYSKESCQKLLGITIWDPPLVVINQTVPKEVATSDCWDDPDEQTLTMGHTRSGDKR